MPNNQIKQTMEKHIEKSEIEQAMELEKMWEEGYFDASLKRLQEYEELSEEEKPKFAKENNIIIDRQYRFEDLQIISQSQSRIARFWRSIRYFLWDVWQLVRYGNRFPTSA